MSTRLAYVIGRYPAASHAFVLREIEALRRHGADIETITIRPPRRTELLTDADRAAAQSTYRVLPAGPLKLLRAHLRALASHPLRYPATLAYALRLGRGARGRLWQLFYFAESVVVWRRCRALGITHLHAQFADTATDSALLCTRLEPGWSWSIAVHGPDEFDESDHNRIGEKLRSARFVVAVSDDARRRAIEVGPEDVAEKIEVVRMGVDPERFRPGDGGRGGAPAQGPSPEAPPRILSLGRLVDRKGQRVLLDVLAGLADARLTIAGDGPCRAALTARAAELGLADRVTFTGVVGQDEALRLYREADVFCLASLAEGLPAVLIEAMACALPVVTTRVGAIGELVVDGRNGLLVEPGDATALGAALGRVLGDREFRDRVREAGRETVRERHDLDRQADQLLALFRAMA